MPRRYETIFGWAVGAVIVAAIIGGLMMVGGPAKARDQKIDNVRLKNMQMSARAISCYADSNAGLPQELETVKQALKERDIGVSAKGQGCQNLNWKTDPVTEKDFEYNRLGPQQFELCGVFARAGDQTSGEKRRVYNARRTNVLRTDGPRTASGRHCFVAKDWSKKT